MSAFADRAARLQKPRPHVLTKREKKAARAAEDVRQRHLCHARSGLRCEVRERILRPEHSALVVKRCKGRVVHNHHLIGGHGRRNIGISILAEHRLDVCKICHQDIEAEILIPTKRDDCFDAATVQYDRVKT